MSSKIFNFSTHWTCWSTNLRNVLAPTFNNIQSIFLWLLYLRIMLLFWSVMVLFFKLCMRYIISILNDVFNGLKVRLSIETSIWNQIISVVACNFNRTTRTYLYMLYLRSLHFNFLIARIIVIIALSSVRLRGWFDTAFRAHERMIYISVGLFPVLLFYFICNFKEPFLFQI